MSVVALWLGLVAGAEEPVEVAPPAPTSVVVEVVPAEPAVTLPAAEATPGIVLSADDVARLRAAAVKHAEEKRRIRLAAMSTLTAWAGANMVAGTVGWATADDTEWVRFHQMNLGWGAVNLAIAVPGLVSALRDDPSRYTLGQLLRSDTGDKIAFGLNTGLDVGYVATGAWLWERGLRTDDPTLVGFGRSLVIQGGFLLIFDAAMLGVHTRHGQKLMVVPELGTVYGLQLVVR